MKSWRERWNKTNVITGTDLPRLSLTRQEYLHVYEPSDDTYLFVGRA